MDRSEDLKQVRDLHLVRDERDREVEAAAGLGRETRWCW